MDNRDELAKGLEAVAGAEAVGAPADAQAFGIEAVLPQVVVTPRDAEGLAASLRVADQMGAAVVPWGGGTEQQLGNPPERMNVTLRTARLNRLIAHEPADLTCVAEAGLRLSDLQSALGKSGQFLPIDPPGPGATLGGVLSTGASGPMRLAYGWPRDVVIGTHVVLASGKRVKAGGRVVKNVSGFDLNKLYVGALGTLGVLVEVNLRLMPLPERRASLAAVFKGLEPAAAAIRAILQANLSPCAVNLLSPRAVGHLSGLGDLPSGGYLVLVRAEGLEEAVQVHLDRLTGLFHSAEAQAIARLTGVHEDGVWDAVRNFRVGPDAAQEAVRCRASLPLKAVSQFMAQADPLVRGRHQISCDMVAQACSGIVHCHLDIETPERIKSAVGAASDLRKLASDLDGNLIVEAAPLAFKSRFDVWGRWGPDLRLMKALKAQFDPNRTLNPGRFVGGI